MRIEFYFRQINNREHNENNSLKICIDQISAKFGCQRLMVSL